MARFNLNLQYNTNNSRMSSSVVVFSDKIITGGYKGEVSRDSLLFGPHEIHPRYLVTYPGISYPAADGV